MAFIQISGTDMPDPVSISVVPSDLDGDNSKRNEMGVLQRDIVRQGIRKVSCKWNALTMSDATLLLDAVKPASVLVQYTDPETGIFRSMTAYAGDRTCEMVHAQGEWRWNISFDLNEY